MKKAPALPSGGRQGPKLSLLVQRNFLNWLARCPGWVRCSRRRALFNFSLVQNQIVCIDDLDRRSNTLDLRDILGLISFLREQRGCKVALILNAEQLGTGKDEFDALLEKVIETKVVLAPMAAETAAIALPAQDAVSIALRTHCETLGIRNIRVIKQIEHLARRVQEHLADFPQPIRDQAIHSQALFGWSKYDRENAPPLEFLRTSSLERHLNRRDTNAPPSQEEARWDSLLEKYKYGRTDDFDFALMKYADTMIFDEDEIKAEALAAQERERLGALHGTFEGAWRAFHDSFDNDEENVVREIVEGTKKAHEVVSLSNLNEAVLLLKQLGREADAMDVLQFFAENRNDPEYWNTQHDPFARGSFDPDLASVIERKKAVPPKEFDVAAALISAGKNYDADTIAKLVTVPVEMYRDLISTARGDHLRSLVLSALEFRRIANASEDMRRVITLMEEALRMIGRKSPLNALRLKKYGISVEVDVPHTPSSASTSD
jgi:hypothetical protein